MVKVDCLIKLWHELRVSTKTLRCARDVEKREEARGKMKEHKEKYEMAIVQALSLTVNGV